MVVPNCGFRGEGWDTSTLELHLLLKLTAFTCDKCFQVRLPQTLGLLCSQTTLGSLHDKTIL